MIKIDGFLRQRILMDFALECVGDEGRKFEPKIDSLNILISIVGWQPIKDHYKKSFNKIKNTIEKAKTKIANIIAYHSDIDQSVVSKEDITSQRFIKYLESVTYMIKNLEIIETARMLLIRKTNLINATIPSSYFTVLSQKEKQMPLSTEETEFMESEMDSEAMQPRHPLDRNLEEY